MVCKHIWYRLFSVDDYTKFYCMKCLKKIQIKNWKNKTGAIIQETDFKEGQEIKSRDGTKFILTSREATLLNYIINEGAKVR